MTKFILFFTILFQFIIVNGQSKTRVITQLNTDTLSENTLLLPMAFNSCNFQAANQTFDYLITKIVLVYTQHRLSPNFNQSELNKKRWDELFKNYPQLLTHNNIWIKEEWQQTETIRAQAKQLFHGFIIYYKPQFSEEERKAEIKWVMQKLRFIESKTDTLKFVNDSISEVNNSNNNKQPLAQNRKFTLKQRWDNRIGFVHDTIWEENTEKNVVTEKSNTLTEEIIYTPKPDSTVFFSFNQLQTDKKYAVVMDATGSMGSYIVDALDWIFDNRNKITIVGFVFFNDGDNKKSKKKKVMHTGGIYSTENDSTKITQTLIKCMKNGNGGGENLENDIEAIVWAIKEFQQADEIILIADNKEWMRDFSYFTKVSKPINVILCDTKYLPPNADYFTLASYTHGTLFTKDKKFTRLNTMKNNDYFIYHGVVYRKFDGLFKREP
jgi:hypothetical protein